MCLPVPGHDSLALANCFASPVMSQHNLTVWETCQEPSPLQPCPRVQQTAVPPKPDYQFLLRSIIEETDEEMVILQPEETKNHLFLHFFSRLCKPHFIDGPGKLRLTEVK